MRSPVHDGVSHVSLSPGSRSTPLALAFARAGVPLTVHLDERSAAYYALGFAKGGGGTAAVVCTSGTAAANLLPAVIEARMSATPLIVLTADRPPELRDTGAWQTIDQVKLFGGYVRWFADLAAPSPDPALIDYAADVARRAVAVAAGDPPGPVHLNLPFREPLAGDATSPRRSYAHVAWGSRVLPVDRIGQLAEVVARRQRGLVLAGPDKPRPGLLSAVERFAEVTGFPVVAEAASQLRFGALGPRISGADAIARCAEWTAAHRPLIVLRLGATPTWRPVGALAASPGAEVVIVDPDATWDNPTHRAAYRVVADPAALLEGLADALAGRRLQHQERAWKAAWATGSDLVTPAISELAAGAMGTSVWVPGVVVDALPEGGVIVAANSMAVRDLDSFTIAGPKKLTVVTNRGAAGIDGTISTALGAANGAGRPTVLLSGDLAFLHDLNGLAAAATTGVPVAIVVVNDGGGGIFAYLDVADSPEFERLFRTPQDVDIGRACAAFGVAHQVAEDPLVLRRGLRAALAEPALTVFEVPVDLEANTRVHRAHWARVAAELVGGGAET